MTPYIKIGQIVNTHGHWGELKIYPLTDDVARFYDLKRVYILQGDAYQLFHVNRARIHQNMVILALKEVTSMNVAEKLKGLYLELPAADLRALPEGHYYIFQLIGLKVYEEGVFLGEVTDILKTGSNDVYVVTRPGKKDIYIPALKDVVKQIDINSGKIEVNLPPGLLD